MLVFTGSKHLKNSPEIITVEITLVVISLNENVMQLFMV